jgi:hypothetical protein
LVYYLLRPGKVSSIGAIASQRSSLSDQPTLDEKSVPEVWRKNSVMTMLETPLQRVVHLLRQMEQDPKLKRWLPELEDAAHTLASHTIHELWKPSIAQDGHHADELWKNSAATHEELAQVEDMLEPRVSEGEARNWRKTNVRSSRVSCDYDERASGRSVISVPLNRLRDKHEVAARAVVQNLTDWEFGAQSIFGHREALGDNLLFFSMEGMLQQLGLMESLRIDPNKLHALCAAITGSYEHVPYHNSTHMCDVVHSFFWLLHQATASLPPRLALRPRGPAQRSRPPRPQTSHTAAGPGGHALVDAHPRRGRAAARLLAEAARARAAAARAPRRAARRRHPRHRPRRPQQRVPRGLRLGHRADVQRPLGHGEHARVRRAAAARRPGARRPQRAVARAVH